MPIILLLLSIVLIIVLTTRLHVHAFLALFVVAMLYAFAAGMPLDQVVASINDGFGSTLGKIGLIIIFGVIIGSFLENSGAAFKLAQKILNIVGSHRVTGSMGFMGFFISIPVFADSGFLLISPLCKTLAKKANISITGPAVALALGLMSSHVMVPPTPGPVAAAGILEADLGLVLLIGIPLSALCVIPCIVFASRVAGRVYIDPAPDITPNDLEDKIKRAPGSLHGSLPILVPILLIILKSLTDHVELPSKTVVHAISFLGEPVIALFIGVLLSLTLPKKLQKDMLSSTGWVGQALKDAAAIILITGAGGIFGKVLQNSGIADWLGDILSNANIGIWLPFILAATIKTAQGSSTVAIITTASILAPLMTTLGFDGEIQRVLVVIAIGAGSAVVSHVNDSFFWVVTQLSGIPVKTGYHIYTLGTLVLGMSAAILVYVLSLIIA